MTNEVKPAVAVVDDDYRMLEGIESLLESAGHVVHLFPSGEAFLESGVLQHIDCLISDIGMTGIDGFALFQLIQQERSDLPVILITGREELLAHPPTEVAPNHFFTKPFDGERLLAAVNRAIHRVR